MHYEWRLSQFSHSVAVIQHFVAEALLKCAELAFNTVFPQFVNYIAARMEALYGAWFTDFGWGIPQQK
ncbi:MAG: hypothetical protein P8Y36_11905 [Alphaproteobacteria bacterium]